MTGPSAEVLADSVSVAGHRLATLRVTMHRFVLAEFNTHRALSRSFRSSRAVPVARLLEEVRTAPATPVHWGSNRPGMQAGDELEGVALENVTRLWEAAAIDAANHAEWLMHEGLHKQVANRVLEPFLYVHGVATATEWDNFLRLRCGPEAQPELRVLACAIRDALAASSPSPVATGGWHLPYVTDDERDAHPPHVAALVSAARCARVSYRPFEGEGSVEDDLALAGRLRASGHWSPFEHQATPDWVHRGGFVHRRSWRNLRGWAQHRAAVDGA